MTPTNSFPSSFDARQCHKSDNWKIDLSRRRNRFVSNFTLRFLWHRIAKRKKCAVVSSMEMPCNNDCRSQSNILSRVITRKKAQNDVENVHYVFPLSNVILRVCRRLKNGSQWMHLKRSLSLHFHSALNGCATEEEINVVDWHKTFRICVAFSVGILAKAPKK